MKIENLSITNFRGITKAELNSLGSMVIIAGQNGSGKSCIFDAIRWLKSVYGGYQQNEWQQWTGEFGLQISNRPTDFLPMFNDPAQEIRIACDFRLAEAERQYISSNLDELLLETVWRSKLPEAYEWAGYRMPRFATQFRELEPEVREATEALRGKLVAELSAELIHGECNTPVGELPHTTNSVALNMIFSTFRPRQVGVIDFHSAQRHYGRERVSGINLNINEGRQQKQQHSLYNTAQKYANVKSEMASSYIREVIAEQAGVPRASQATLTNTLKDLFATFFPEKEFLGPRATPEGGLDFSVRTSNGSVHDLDELSAGEKEILYGYLRIRDSAPRFSIILLDEPELHLNPRLVRELPKFYQKNLGEDLENQIWLVSHSDALLREVVGHEKYSVFHMLPCSAAMSGESQCKPLNMTADLELALIDLVGDLAAYRPGGRVVIFEGGGDSDFDRKVVSSLFPEIQANANLISATNKTRVHALHEILDRASKRGDLPFTFFAITDRDSDREIISQRKGVNFFSWDVYHIENYFLQPDLIQGVLISLGISPHPSMDEIGIELRECARELMPALVTRELAAFANRKLVRALNTLPRPRTRGDVEGVRSAVQKSVEDIIATQANDLTHERLEEHRVLIQTGYENALLDGSWSSIFPGRDLLRLFSDRRVNRVRYDVFMTLLLSKMRETNFRPQGMQKIVDKILS